MASLETPKTRGNEQTDQDVLDRVCQAYTKKKEAALEAPADEAN